MTLHFIDATTHSSPSHMPTLIFRYMPLGYMETGFIRLELNQDVDKLSDAVAKTQIMQQAFSAAISLFKQTWDTERRLPTEHAPYRESRDFTLTNQEPLSWEQYELTLDEE